MHVHHCNLICSFSLTNFSIFLVSISICSSDFTVLFVSRYQYTGITYKGIHPFVSSVKEVMSGNNEDSFFYVGNNQYLLICLSLLGYYVCFYLLLFNRQCQFYFNMCFTFFLFVQIHCFSKIYN